MDDTHKNQWNSKRKKNDKKRVCKKIDFTAKVLDVTEQELFDDSAKAMKKCFRYFLKKADDKEIESFFQSFINSKIQNNVNVNFGKVVMKNELLG